MRDEMNTSESNNEELNDNQLEAAAGGILWFVVAGAVIGWQFYEGIFNEDKKAQ
jgi:hypothetical protein